MNKTTSLKSTSTKYNCTEHQYSLPGNAQHTMPSRTKSRSGCALPWMARGSARWGLEAIVAARVVSSPAPNAS